MQERYSTGRRDDVGRLEKTRELAFARQSNTSGRDVCEGVAVFRQMFSVVCTELSPRGDRRCVHRVIQRPTSTITPTSAAIATAPQSKSRSTYRLLTVGTSDVAGGPMWEHRRKATAGGCSRRSSSGRRCSGSWQARRRWLSSVANSTSRRAWFCRRGRDGGSADQLSGGLPVLWQHVSRAPVNPRRERARSLVLVEFVLLAEHVVQHRQELVRRQCHDPPRQGLRAALAAFRAPAP